MSNCKIKKEQIALGNYHYVSWSLDYFLKSAKNIGLENIEIWGAKPHITVDGHSIQAKKEIASKISEYGLKVVCFCPEQNTYPVDISTADNEFRRYSIEHMRRAIETASILGADTMLLCPGNGYIDEPRIDIRSRFLDSVAELLVTAQKNGVILALETQDQSDSLFLNTVYDQKSVIDEINHPYFKAMLDTVQLGQFDSSTAEDIHILGIQNIKHVHLGNTILREKTHNEKQLPEGLGKGRSVCGHIGFREGNLPLAQYLFELGNAEYQRYITIEICQRPYFFEADRYAREAYQYVIEIIQ